MTDPGSNTKNIIKAFRERRRSLRIRYGDVSYTDAKQWFGGIAEFQHLRDDFTGDAILTVEGNALGATITPCVGRPWRITLGPQVILSREERDADPTIVDRWDLALPDGNDLQLIQANASGNAPRSSCSWRELLDRLAAETIAALGPTRDDGAECKTLFKDRVQ